MYKKTEDHRTATGLNTRFAVSKLRAALLPALLAPLAAAPLAQAQDANSRQLEEITVTARQVVENLQDVPVAVTAFSEREITQLFAQNLADFSAYAPNTTIGVVPGFNAASIAIRGVSTGDIPSTFDPAVTVAVDGFYLGHYQASLLDMFDIQQVDDPVLIKICFHLEYA